MDVNDQIVLYKTPDGHTELEVRLQEETMWLTQKQIAELFDTDRTVIVRHIHNIYKTEELEEMATCAKIAQVRQEGKRTITRELPFYNLDMILSVGYRVNSKNATAFRRWANRVLKDYLLKGYAVNRNIQLQHYTELKQLVGVLERMVKQQEKLSGNEAGDLISVVSDYTLALDTLDKYDYQQLEVADTTNEQKFRATYENAMTAIWSLKEKFGGSMLFANEKDDSFKSSIGQIYQTFDGKDLYPSVEEKAAVLLYLVTKNHSFSDGNKRIAATLFLWYLANNGILYNPDGSKRIADNTLVALTLMIAESRTEEKDVMVKVVVNLINKSNYA
ncbi:MAG: virulence protein RhuM/Fic/DOC family protein [Paludibacteraceae bacterium]|nr:virulence protein RhuM/Fic/DOC family protein [Paludibacteraceae bacterium]